ncbi:Lpg1974 family pore-forming outer membrane protein [Novipirellula caenicola]|uniref:Legionella pneumophila major outer membrane protein n=1 Tax=Novipirellula caenicola TaxID=1536901 RepID=A0ABP9VTC7_9BACT
MKPTSSHVITLTPPAENFATRQKFTMMPHPTAPQSIVSRVRPAFIGLVGLCLQLLAFMTAPPAIAEETDGLNFANYLQEGEIDSEASETAEQVVQTTAIDYSGGAADLSIQVAELQAQMSEQNFEIATLRSELQTPLRHAHKPQPAKWFVTYESVVVQPVQSNSTGLITEREDDVFSHVMFPWGMEHSPRIQLGREANDETLGWRVRYWQFRHGESFEASDANGLIPASSFTLGTVGYLFEDGDASTGLQFIEEGVFTSSVRADVIDWELQRQIVKPLDVYAGIRYAKIAQRYHAMTDAGNLDARSEFRGFGPTVAMRFTHALPLNTLSLFGNARGSLLFGQKDFTAVDDVNEYTQAMNAIDLRSSEDAVHSFAGNAEIQLGLRYTPATWFSMQVALEAQHFMDVGGANPTGVFTGPDGGMSGDSPLDDNLSFIGVSSGIELAY